MREIDSTPVLTYTQFTMLCPHCQQPDVPDQAQSCPACGASLVAPPAGRTPPNISIQQRVELAGPGSRVIGVHVEHMGYSAEEVRSLLDEVQRRFAPRPFSGECPYLGLEPFQESDAARFYGREELVQALLQRLQMSRFLVVAGPSGSGKSSLVRAGLLPTLRRGGLPGSQVWLYAALRPGRRPLQSLGRALAALGGRLDAEELLEQAAQSGAGDPSLLHRLLEAALGGDPDRRALLFIDQFEELFSQTGEAQEAERRYFLEALTYPAAQAESRAVVVVTLRSDFIAACAPYPRLNDLLNQGFLQVGALSPAGLVQAIARPALDAGLQLDPALVERIVQEMGSQPGALPLMQFALRDLFEAEVTQGSAAALSLPGYLGRGGLYAALERHANRAFQALEAPQQTLAQAVFRKLVSPGAGQLDSARTALIEELTPAGGDPAQVRELVRRLADARLVTTARDEAGEPAENPGEYYTVRLAHERLLEAWPWLHEIVEKNRKAIALENEIQSDALRWQEHPDDEDSYLYRGARLAAALAALAGGASQSSSGLNQPSGLALSGLARRFLERSAEREREELARQQAAQQALEQAGQLLERQQTRERRRAWLWALGVTLAVTAAVLLGVLADLSRREAVSKAQTATYAQGQATLQEQRVIALTQEVVSSQLGATAAAAEAGYQRAVSAARRLADSAASVDDPVLAALLSVEAVQAASPPPAEAVSQLHRTLAGLTGRRVSASAGCAAQMTAGADGRWLACIDPGSTALLVWQIQPGGLLSQPVALDSNNAWIAASPSGGRWLAANNITNGLELFDLQPAQGGLPQAPLYRLAPQQATITAPAFSPDGRLLAYSLDQDVVVWDLENLPAGETYPPPWKSTPATDFVLQIAFQPGTSRLAWMDWDGRAQIWDYQSGEVVEDLVMGESVDGESALAVDPTGRWLAMIHSGSLRLADLQTAHPLSESLELAADINLLTPEFDLSMYWRRSIAFSPDGQWLAAAGADQGVLVWDLASGSLDEIQAVSPRQIGSLQSVVQVAFSPDGRWLAAGDLEGRVLAASLDDQRRTALNAIHLEERVLSFRLFSAAVSSLVFIDEGCTLLSSSVGGEMNAWELCSGRQAGYDVLGLSPPVFNRAVLAQNGQRAAALLQTGAPADGGRLRAWNLGGGAPGARWSDLPVALPVSASLAISPDSSWLVGWENEPPEWLGLWHLSGEPPEAARRILLAWAAGGAPFDLLTVPGLPAPQQALLSGEQASLAPLVETDLRAEYRDLRPPTPEIPGDWTVVSSLDGTHLSAAYDGYAYQRPADIPPRRLFWLDRRPDAGSPGASWQEIPLGENLVSAPISPDGRWLALHYVSGTNTVLFDLQQTPPVSRSLETINSPRYLQISPDGRWLAADTGQTITLLDLSAHAGSEFAVQVTRSAGISNMLFSPQGTNPLSANPQGSRWLAVEEGPFSRGGEVRLWLLDLSRPRPEMEARLLSQQPEVIRRLAFSADGSRLAALVGYSELRVFDLSRLEDNQAGSPVNIPIATNYSLDDLRFSPDARWLAASSGSALWFYPLELDELIARACQAAGRDLSEQEAQAYLPGEEYRGTCP